MARYLKIEYLYVFVLIVWTPISFVLGLDSMGRVKMIFTLIILFAIILRNSNSLKYVFRVSSVKLLMCLLLYMMVNYLAFFIPSNPAKPSEELVTFFSLIYPFVLLLIVAIAIVNNNFVRLINVLVVSFYFWTIILLTFATSSLSLDSRLTISGIDANDFGFVSVTIIMLLLIKVQLYDFSKKYFIVLSLFPLIVILLTGSRTSIGCIGIMFLSWMISQFKNMSASTFVRLVFTGIVAYIGIVFVLNQTQMGERLSNTTGQTELSESIKTGTILDYAGDRGVFYYYGWKAFEQEPIHGIGLSNFGKKKMFLGLVCHSEYMVQLAECGLFGFILFFLFLVSLYKLIRSVNYSIKRSLLYSALGIVVFVAMFFWTYDRIYIYIYYGFIIGEYCHQKRQNMIRNVSQTRIRKRISISV